MDVYTHEKEQIENIKAWWRENRLYIIAGLLISAAIVGGWRYWGAHQQQQAEAASQRYEALLTQATVGDLEAVQAGVNELQAEYDGTPYAALATLRLAAMQVREGDYSGAEDSLRWAMANTDDAELAVVARLRLARVLVQQQDATGAQDVLAGVNASKFRALQEEIRGDALLLQGDREAAQAAYESALAAMEPGLGDREFVQRKLRNVELPTQMLAAGASTETQLDEPAGEQPLEAEGAPTGEIEQ